MRRVPHQLTQDNQVLFVTTYILNWKNVRNLAKQNNFTGLFIFNENNCIVPFLSVLSPEILIPHHCNRSVCLSVCVYSGYIIHHYNGIWGTCAPSGRNMHHHGAICTMVHKGDYVFWKIQGTLMIFCFGGTYMYLNGSHGWLIGSQVFEWVTLLQLFLGSQVFFIRIKNWCCQRCPHTVASST